MANAIYPTFLEAALGKEHELDADDIKATLIDSGDYSYGAGHEIYGGGTPDVADASKVAVSAQLTTPTIVVGVFDCDDFTWSSATGDESEAIIIWNDDIADDRVIVFYDTGMGGMPVTPNGGDINVTVNTAGWFAL